MKAAAPKLRVGELNEFDKGFQAEMDNLTQGVYEAYTR